MDDKSRLKYMQQALRLALKGAGFVAPNPMVGAVIVKNNQMIGRGYHRRFGDPHAEIEALNDCKRKGNDPTDATMFVNLEPCCHHGKTGPCTDAIIGAGIAQVEIATLDEFESVQGRGADQLRSHGIRVQVGCCENQARRLNTGYFQHVKTGRPSVILKWAQSLDGRLEYPKDPETRRAYSKFAEQPQSPGRWISNDKSRRHVHQVRSRCGAILVGIGTVLADDPLLTVRLGGKRYQPRRVVLDSQLRIPEASRLVTTAADSPVLIYALAQSVRDNGAVLSRLQGRGCEVIGLAGQEGRIDLESLLVDLGARGVTDLLVEGGATILQSFMEQQLVDKFMIYIAPVLIGSQSEAAKVDFSVPYDQLHDITLRKFDTDILIEAYAGKIES